MATGAWDQDLAAAMGWPFDAAVKRALDLWSLSEDSDGTGVRSVYNYIAITWPPSGLPPWNSFTSGGVTYHVQRYANETAGVKATVTFLRSGNRSILDQAMNAGMWKGKLENIYYAINGGGFCGGCQGGKYPIRLYDFLSGHIRSQPSQVLVPFKGPVLEKTPTSIFTAWHDLTRQVSITIPRELRRMEKDRRAIMNSIQPFLPSDKRTRGH